MGCVGCTALINASNIINDLNAAECDALFKDIVTYLDRERNLSKILVEGLNVNILGELLNNIEGLNLQKRMPFKGKPETGLTEFWKKMQSFLKEENRVALLVMGGVNDHWSVVNEISEKRLSFCDSDEISFFNRSSCTTKEPNSSRIHQIMPTHTYFLSASNPQA